MRLRMIIGRRLQCPQIHKKLNRTKKLKQKDLNTYTKTKQKKTIQART